MEFLNKIKQTDFRFDPPYFYNNDFALRCELGIGETDSEYMKNAKNRALKIFSIVFRNKPELFFFDHFIYDDSTVDDDKELINNRIDIYKKDLRELAMLQSFGFELINDVTLSANDRENDAIKRNRFIVFTHGKNINYKKLLNMQCENGRRLHFVSLEDECIFSIYDDRGLDIVFTSKEKGKPFYEKLKPYLLQYDIEKMKATFE